MIRFFWCILAQIFLLLLIAIVANLGNFEGHLRFSWALFVKILWGKSWDLLTLALREIFYT